MAKLVNALDFDSSIPLFESECRSQNLGGLVERLNTPVLKTGKGISSVFRGFESHTLFHNICGRGKVWLIHQFWVLVIVRSNRTARTIVPICAIGWWIRVPKHVVARCVWSLRSDPTNLWGKYSMWITNVSLSNTMSITRLSTMRTML